MRSQIDVAVIGGGPAGLVAAERTARAGLRTGVFERNEAIGIPVRTSGGSFIESLVALGVPRELYQPIQTVRVLSARAEARFHYPKPVTCVLDVRRLYQYLAGRAVAAGARIRLKALVERPLFDGERVVGVAVRDNLGGPAEVGARVVVDASGHSATVARRIGLHAGFEQHGFGVEYDLYAPQFDQSEAWLLVGEDVAPQGYGWAFPYGNCRVRLGIGVGRPQSSADPRDYLDELPRRIPALGQACAGASPLEFHSGLIPMAPPARSFVADGLVAVGDAAGQMSTLVGEGIRYAMHAGQLAGEVVAQACAAGDTSAAGLRGYDETWRRIYQRNLDLAYHVSQRFVGFGDADWDDQIRVLSRLSPAEFARGLKGDFSAGWALGIALRHPGLLRETRSLMFLLPAVFNGLRDALSPSGERGIMVDGVRHGDRLRFEERGH